MLIRLALSGLSPMQIVLGRMCIGALVLLGVVGLRRLRLPTGAALWGRFTVAAVFANALPYYLFAWAELTVPSNVAGALTASAPLFTLGAAVLFGQEPRPLSRGRLAGLVLGFAGVLVVLAPWRADDALGSLAGQLACLAASASYALAYVYMARAITPAGLDQLVNAATQLTAASVLLLAAAPFAATGPVRLDAAVAGSVLALGVLGTGVAYLLNYRLIADEGPTTASVVSYLLPVVAVALGVATLDEPFTWNLVAGTAVVLAGVALVRVPRWTAGQEPARPRARGEAPG